ncbi:hypothetical protein A4X13_0g5413 [Tilletia indica]|uniref:Uncharacterized protein n=1 Tax=Tilletia indica TaxID=43049 RepID=A0A177TPZ9_9BASI|nr:hypothetical protein A4X13_0g5413 [Tilletia indica]
MLRSAVAHVAASFQRSNSGKHASRRLAGASWNPYGASNRDSKERQPTRTQKSVELRKKAEESLKADEEAQPEKSVVVRNVKTTDDIATAIFARVNFTKIAYQCSSFRLKVIKDAEYKFNPHSEAPWLPQPAQVGTHKERHLRILTGKMLEDGTLSEGLDKGRPRDKGRSLTVPAAVSTVRSRLDESSHEKDEDESIDEGAFNTLGETFTIDKPRQLALPPLPWPEREIELRTLFINSKKETHKSAVVRNRCKRRLQAALNAIFLPAGNSGRMILREGALGLLPPDLSKFVHTDYVYVLFPQSITFTAKMREMAKHFCLALEHTSKQITAPPKPAPSRPSFERRPAPRRDGYRESGGFSKRPHR